MATYPTRRPYTFSELIDDPLDCERDEVERIKIELEQMSVDTVASWYSEQGDKMYSEPMKQWDFTEEYFKTCLQKPYVLTTITEDSSSDGTHVDYINDNGKKDCTSRHWLEPHAPMYKKKEEHTYLENGTVLEMVVTQEFNEKYFWKMFVLGQRNWDVLIGDSGDDFATIVSTLKFTNLTIHCNGGGGDEGGIGFGFLGDNISFCGDKTFSMCFVDKNTKYTMVMPKCRVHRSFIDEANGLNTLVYVLRVDEDALKTLMFFDRDGDIGEYSIEETLIQSEILKTLRSLSIEETLITTTIIPSPLTRQIEKSIAKLC